MQTHVIVTKLCNMGSHFFHFVKMLAFGSKIKRCDFVPRTSSKVLLVNNCASFVIKLFLIFSINSFFHIDHKPCIWRNEDVKCMLDIISSCFGDLLLVCHVNMCVQFTLNTTSGSV